MTAPQMPSATAAPASAIAIGTRDGQPAASVPRASHSAANAS
jgi:hypothetical protein